MVHASIEQLNIYYHLPMYPSIIQFFNHPQNQALHTTTNNIKMNKLISCTELVSLSAITILSHYT
jgi:hypothetical protein